MFKRSMIFVATVLVFTLAIRSQDNSAAAQGGHAIAAMSVGGNMDRTTLLVITEDGDMYQKVLYPGTNSASVPEFIGNFWMAYDENGSPVK